MTPAIIPPRITVREMELGDIQSVHRIDVASFALPWTERSYLFELNDNPNSLLWVAEVEDENGARQVVGLVVVWLILDEAHIGSIAVAPEYRQQGIGRLLLAHTLVETAARGAVEATLEVRRSNLAAQALYRRFGFTVVGMRPRYYRDNNEDALLMTLSGMEPEGIQKLTAEILKPM